MRVIMMCGLPRAGKSTYVAKLVKDLERKGERVAVISTDNIRFGLLGKWFDERFENFVWRTTFHLFEDYLSIQEEHDLWDVIIVDSCNLSAYIREQWLEIVELFDDTELDIDVECIVVDTPITRIKKRNANSKRSIVPDSMMESMINRFEKPKKEEGFKTVTTVKGYR